MCGELADEVLWVSLDVLIGSGSNPPDELSCKITRVFWEEAFVDGFDDKEE